MSRDVAVVGGGVIGLAIAWRCAQCGLSVTVYHDDPGASWVAAGILGAVGEAYFGETALTTLLVAAVERWPAFAAELGEVGYEVTGTLLVALTADDRAEAARLWTYQESLGLPVRRLPVAALREREPALHPRVRAGALAETDHQVDPRRLVPALRTAAETAGVRVERRRVSDLSDLEESTVVVAAGCGSAALTGLPVRPVKGQLLRLGAPGGPGFRHVIRGWADGRSVYLVPRADGEVVVGATVEERVDGAATAGAVLDLLRAAVDLVPEVAEYELVEVGVGMRPGTPDNAPILGALRDRVIVATGHYRHGILLTPITADAIASLVATGETPDDIAPFSPRRLGVPA
jgi:glycine oxidase